MNEPRQTLFQPIKIEDADYAEFSAEKSEEQIEWETFRDEMKEANEYPRITVYRQPMDGTGQRGQKKLTFLFDVGLEEYQYSQLCARLRDEYGSGTYRMQGRDSENKLRFNRAVTIEAPKIEDDKGHAQSIPNIIAEMRHTMNEQNSQMADFMRGPNSMVDPMEQMTKMATAFSTIFAAMGLKQPEPVAQKTMLEQMQEFALMKELMQGFSGSGDGDGESNLFSLLTATVKSFGPALGAAIAQGQQSGAIPVSGPIVAALPNPAEQPEPTMSQQALEMKPQIDFLVMQAKSDANPYLVAETLLPNIPETAYESIESFLLQENVINICSQINIEVNNYRQWFIDWCKKMLELLGEKLDGPPDLELEPETPEVPEVSDEPAPDDPEKELTPALDAAQTPENDVAGGPDPGKATESDISASEPDADDSDSKGDS